MADQKRAFDDVPSLHGVVRDHFATPPNPDAPLIEAMARADYESRPLFDLSGRKRAWEEFHENSVLRVTKAIHASRILVAIRAAGWHVAQHVSRPLDDWHEDFGPALWWRFPVEEPPYAGTPLDIDWPGCHTHWTPLPPAPQLPDRRCSRFVFKDGPPWGLDRCCLEEGHAERCVRPPETKP